MKDWSKSWKSSARSGKKRKFQFKAPKHIRRKFVSAHLSKELIQKYSRRSVPLRKGDIVKIMNGDLKGKIGKVTSVNTTKYKIYVEGISNSRKDGNQSPRALEPSNLMVTTLNLEDQKRSAIFKRKQEKTNEQKTS
jgi:large subunit ribosomal protein L24|tara:strand:+ start:788 stop:1195 length:408 start_codon:yes stop_codon:yes gene_type:complete